MLEILLASILCCIAIFFYKQSVCEFRINQIEWTQRSQLLKLYTEKVPIVIRTIPSATFWTTPLTSSYDTISVFHEMKLTEWIQQASPTSVCPWKYSHAEQIASVSGISIWANKWITPSIAGYYRMITIPKYHCWAGTKGLHKTMAWTFLFATQGELHVTIMPDSMEAFLPAEWLNMFPSDITEKDTPFVAELKYIDIILRPGNVLFMPPHWFMSWVSVATKSVATKSVATKSGATKSGVTKSGVTKSGLPKNATKSDIAMACSISYHTPLSYIAFQTSPYVQH